MATTTTKQNTLKAKRSLKSLFVDPKDNIPPTPKHIKSSSLDSFTSTSTAASSSTILSNPTTGPSATVPSYSTFLADLISSFNAISAPTSTVKTSFEGVDHEAQVDMREKQKVVRALRKANPAQVNEVISLLKAMPDPSTIAKTAAKTRTSTTTNTTNTLINPGYSAATMTKKTVVRIQGKLKPEEEDDLSEWNKIERKRPSERKSNDQTTGVLDAESAKAEAEAASWWPSVSFTSLLSTNSSSTAAPTRDIKAATQPKTASMALTTMSEKPSAFWSTLKGKSDLGTFTGTQKAGATKDRGLSTGKQIALAAAALMAAAAIARPKGKSDISTKISPTNKTKPAAATVKSPVATKAQKPPIPTSTVVNASSTFSSVFKGSKKMALPVEEPSFLVSTINSLTRQLLALHGPPPTHMISAYTFWWGYEIYVPHKCMASIDRGLSTSQVFLGFLTGAIGGIPGLASLVPIAKIISAWVGYQWGVIKIQDTGKGVVISATWVLPVALASRPWDHDGNEDEPLPAPVKGSLKSRLRLIKI
ncbi:hypothetical protein BGZ59_008143 [Podila verticillata]|nr:hypothetical protein BGZ59_008143 [Podila verticillata]KFH64371.1 hypothetical protein MVEG_10196 [Podila verticillata NRRL 6337]